MKFAEVIGHDRAKKALKTAIQRQAIHHAYLITGLKGMGRGSLGTAFAHRLLCQGEGEDSCGLCPPCLQLKHQSNPNYRTFGGLGKPIKVAEVRELIQWVNLKAMGGGRRAALLHGVHEMLPSAANALLKTLEEPPPKTTLILTATSIDQVLSTVRSRCQHIRLSPLPNDKIAEILVERRGIALEEAQQLAVISAGSLGLALSLDESALSQRLQFFDTLLNLKGMTIAQWLKTTETLGKDRQQTRQFLHFFETLLRDGLCTLMAPKQSLVNRDLAPEISQWAASYGIHKLLSLRTILGELQDALAVNIGGRVVLERLYLQLSS